MKSFRKQFKTNININIKTVKVLEVLRVQGARNRLEN